MRVLILAGAVQFPKFASFHGPDVQASLATPEDFFTGAVDPAHFDALFLRTKDQALLAALAAEKNLPAVVCNPVAAVRLSLDRHAALAAAAGAGVPVPRQYRRGEPADGAVVAKDPVDVGASAARVLDAAAWNRLAAGPGAAVYAQGYLDADWEYKVYVCGDDAWTFRQRPLLVNPDKLATREPVDPATAPVAWAFAASRAAGLAVASVDFLRTGDGFRCTDVNPTPGFQHLDGGYAPVVRLLARLVDTVGKDRTPEAP